MDEGIFDTLMTYVSPPLILQQLQRVFILSYCCTSKCCHNFSILNGVALSCVASHPCNYELYLLKVGGFIMPADGAIQREQHSWIFNHSSAHVVLAKLAKGRAKADFAVMSVGPRARLRIIPSDPGNANLVWKFCSKREGYAASTSAKFPTRFALQRLF